MLTNRTNFTIDLIYPGNVESSESKMKSVRQITSTEWKLFRFHKMNVNDFEILLIMLDVTFYV